MNTTFLAHFDGTNFVPDEPVNLPVGTSLRLQVNATSNLPTDSSAGVRPNQVTPAPRLFEPLNIPIDPKLSHAIALDPEFDIAES